ncbi:MAG: hypothetical protein SGPRY_004816 [Prymnesium sp.]
MVSVPEFHTTNLFSPMGERPVAVRGRDSGAGYKAIIVLYMGGGADTFNLLTPLGQCTHDLYSEYQTCRGVAALGRGDVLPIVDDSGRHTCNQFGVHASMPLLKAAYDAGEASFIANIGSLVEPTSRDEYYSRSTTLPPSLFAHNAQTQAAHNLDSTNMAAKGVLGRIIETLDEQESFGPQTAAYSLSGKVKILEGEVPPVELSSSGGFNGLSWERKLKETVQKITGRELTSPLAETYAISLEDSFQAHLRLSYHIHISEKAEDLARALQDVTLSDAFLPDGSRLQQSFEQVATLIL